MVLPNGWPTKGVRFYFRLGPLQRSHNCRPPTCLEQDLMKLYSSDNVYIMACVEIYCIKHLLMSSSLESTPVPFVWHNIYKCFLFTLCHIIYPNSKVFVRREYVCTLCILWDHSFSTCADFSEKLTFLTSRIVYVCVLGCKKR